MAAELEKFIVDQLKNLPSESPDRGFLERTLLETRLHLIGVKFPEEILTEGFASRVNVVASTIPNEARTADLIYHHWDVIDHELPHWQFEWRSFIKSLPGKEKKALSQILYPLNRYAAQTIGDFRATSYEQLLKIRRIGEKGVIFAKLAFLRDEPTT